MSLIITNKKKAWVFVASVGVCTLLAVVNGRQLNVAEILGGTLGLMLVPFLIAHLAKWICRLLKVKFEDREYIIAYAGVWTLLVAMNLLTAALNYGFI